MTKPKVIAVVGPTASGKTSLSIELAKKYNGEVISADSRQVYRGMDLGTGKVTTDEMDGVPHHLLDICDPMDVYTGADFARDGAAALQDILKRGRTPIVAGGSFFYLDLLRGKSTSAPVEPDETFRESLGNLSNATLMEMLLEKDSVRAATIDTHNRRRLIRALEIIHTLGNVPLPTETESPYEWLILGIDIEKEILHDTIYRRLISRLKSGMIVEARNLHGAGVNYQRMEDIGLEYRYLARHLQGELSESEMTEVLNTKIRQFAKRQLTWLKRDEEIEWFAPQNREAILRRVSDFLAE
ncbi:tRNA (adenosine(37)-N6)-dimethylallyltransferase MiaA [Candidatus Kaiserbacteria bacterium]|nr:tRNA (adenosine(37)-N6)-dimethylallyltransferase MiaA [Candidatus Kaiserbacteria bacterium]USN88534.1 MAG: tRNA (adenosine(37)-N6)-dimethylallyltransferase MiaA [Candidatus Nomurabacteria bacterium]